MLQAFYKSIINQLLSAGFMAGRIIMAMLAKFFIFISFDAVYVYAAELFPTVIRYDLSLIHPCCHEPSLYQMSKVIPSPRNLPLFSLFKIAFLHLAILSFYLEIFPSCLISLFTGYKLFLIRTFFIRTLRLRFTKILRTC